MNHAMAVAQQKAQAAQANSAVTIPPGDAFVKAIWQAHWHIKPAGARATLCCVSINGAYVDAPGNEMRQCEVCPDCARRLARRISAAGAVSANGESTTESEE